jgi:formate dehydrogenase major subunit
VVVTRVSHDAAFIARALRGCRIRAWRAFIREPRNSPEALASGPACRPPDARAARLYATGGNAAIYYGLGVTEHSQGSTAVMAIANLAMLTGNIGRPAWA